MAIRSKPFGLRVAEVVGRKLASKIGEVLEIDMFEVKGRENRIVKARVELNGSGRIKDSLKLSGPYLDKLEIGVRYERIGVVCLYCAELGHGSRNCPTLLEDSQHNRIKQEKLGEWVKADQVGKRLHSEVFKNSKDLPKRDGHFPQPGKKPQPDWLADSLSKLNLKETPNKLRSQSSEAERSTLSEITAPMNTEENIVCQNNHATDNRSVQRIKQAARCKGGEGMGGCGNKRSNPGKENSDNWKKVCLENRELKEAEVEGASRQLAPKGISGYCVGTVGVWGDP
ncbi:hypothetical protein PIB30_040967 [Stylosanthes scabra]|uniref:CCHC-type domain-containing protein n=1 Tax=Stylosanthes scabra TaxID=79078 RepID=A0ABU6TF28_9FABA|nr:hypothetical protein [Stylosanthes scabra]